MKAATGHRVYCPALLYVSAYLREDPTDLAASFRFWPGALWCAIVFLACGGTTPSKGSSIQRDASIIFPVVDFGSAGEEQGSTEVLEDLGSFLDVAQTFDVIFHEDVYSVDNVSGDVIYVKETLVDTDCVPNCAGKACGPDGCGGSCGSCKPNEVCQQGSCICIPNCANRECGPDGCGGTCAPGCPAGIMCVELTGKCAKTGPCSAKVSVACEGDYAIYSDNTGWQPNSDILDQYSCTDVLAHGPEKVFSFVAPQSGLVSWKLSGVLPSGFLRLFLLEDSAQGCTSASCVAWGEKVVSWNVEAQKKYFIVVDAVQNNTASFTLTTECSWVPVEPR